MSAVASVSSDRWNGARPDSLAVAPDSKPAPAHRHSKGKQHHTRLLHAGCRCPLVYAPPYEAGSRQPGLRQQNPHVYSRVDEQCSTGRSFNEATMTFFDKAHYWPSAVQTGSTVSRRMGMNAETLRSGVTFIDVVGFVPLGVGRFIWGLRRSRRQLVGSLDGR